MLALVIIFLIVLYVLKIFLPEHFILIIENEQLILIGNFIDTHWWLSEIVACITSFTTYYLYLCAVLKKYYLNLKEVLCLIAATVLVQVMYIFDIELASTLSIIVMITLPTLFKAHLNTVAVVFTTHTIAQKLSISIRNLPALLTNVNFISIFILGLECYFWLLLFYFYYNYKQGEQTHG